MDLATDMRFHRLHRCRWVWPALLAVMPGLVGAAAEPPYPHPVRLEDPLLAKKFLELPPPKLEESRQTAGVTTEISFQPERPSLQYRLAALRWAQEMEERRLEEQWRPVQLEALSEPEGPTVPYFALQRRAPVNFYAYGFAIGRPVYVLSPRYWPYDAFWYYGPYCWFGPGSTWWILHGPGTIERWDSPFPEYGRYEFAAFFRPRETWWSHYQPVKRPGRETPGSAPTGISRIGRDEVRDTFRDLPSSSGGWDSRYSRPEPRGHGGSREIGMRPSRIAEVTGMTHEAPSRIESSSRASRVERVSSSISSLPERAPAATREEGRGSKKPEDEKRPH